MGSFGENLRRERELRGVSLREVADATKISVRFLAALEQNKLDILPGGLFPRAFVRQYAKHLGLDVDRVVAEFLYAAGPETPREPQSSQQRAAPPWGAMLVAGLAILTLLAWVARPGVPGPGPEAEVAVREFPARPVASLPSMPVYSPTNARAAASSEQALVLAVSATADCWVEIKADGRVLVNRVLAEGESETWSAQDEIVLSVGNAGGVEFKLNDKPGLPLGKSGEVRKNVVITRKSLPSLVRDTPASATRSAG